MSKPRSRVSEAVRDVVSLMIDAGGGRARDGAALFQQHHSDLLDEYGRTLALSQITNLIRNEFKQFKGDAEAGQPILPGLLAVRLKKLPVCINVPTDDGDTVYRPLHRATMTELAACIGARSSQLQQDAAVLRDLRELHAERASQGAVDEDLVFQPAEMTSRSVSAQHQPGAPS